MVERVEIIRVGTAVIYESDAIAGPAGIKPIHRLLKVSAASKRKQRESSSKRNE
jgi:outer membrane cobalamin receptor